MKILKKILDNNVIVGYLVEDGDFTLPICKKALYADLYIAPLTQSGYKYYSYEANEIEDESGCPITELPAMDFTEVDSVEWFASIDYANTDALNDAEASKYYSFKKHQFYNFRTEPTYEITTREQLLAYLNEVKRMFYSVNFSTDVRPLNYFVHPDALFTVEELAKNPELKDYFDIIVKRHHIRDYKNYKKLIEWLNEQGVLNTYTPSMAEFLAAYYAWGPEGLRDKCTKVETKLNVDGNFSFVKDPLSGVDPESRVLDNRVRKVAILGSDEKIHFLKTHEDLSRITDLRDFGRNRIAIPVNDQLALIKRSTNIGKRYQMVSNVRYSDVSDRLYITIMSESGYMYLYKVSHNKLRISYMHTSSNQSIYATDDNFCLACLVPSVGIPIDVINSEKDYALWNIAVLKSAKLIKGKTFEPPVGSTSEFMLNDGVNPIAVVDYMANAIVKNSNYTANRKYVLQSKADDLRNAFELYLQPIPAYILQSFNLSEDDIENGVPSFLDLADVDELEDRRELMMQKKINPGDPGFDYTYADYKTKFAKDEAVRAQLQSIVNNRATVYDAIDYYTKLRFVNDCLQGNLALSNFGEGKLDDLGTSYKTAAECLVSIIYAHFGNDPDINQAMEALINLEDSDLIDINRVFKTREAAVKGYMVDFAEYRKTRACMNTWVWAYCTRVFREISNAPIEEQRPYLMELVCLENAKPDMITRQLMTECVKQAIEKESFETKKFDNYGVMELWNERKCAEHSIEYIAARLFFFIYAGGIKTEPVDGNYKVTIDLFDSRDLVVDVPVNVVDFIKKFNAASHKKYMTVYDYCKYEYNANTTTGTFNICLVNADVDPWHVKPKKGYSIKSYGLLPNYYEPEILNKANGENFYELATTNKGICISPLKKSYKINFLPTADFNDIMLAETEVRNATDIASLAGFMEHDQLEYIFAYVRRWAIERKRANDMGKKLVSIPLKQDIVYANIAHIYCDTLPAQEPVYCESTEFNDKNCNSDISTRVVSWKEYVDTTHMITTKQMSIEEFAIHKLSEDELTTMIRVLTEGVEEVPVTVTGNYLNINSDTLIRVPASRLTGESIEEFINSKILIKINENKYFIHALNGDYIMEV